MLHLEICKIPDNSFAINNTISHSKDDIVHDTTYLTLLGTTYKSIANNTIKKGKIGIGKIQRFNNELGKIIDVQQKNIDPKNINTLTVVLYPHKKLRNTIRIDEEDIINIFKKKFINDHYFHPGQLLVFKVNNDNIIAEIKSETPGFLTNNTKLNLISTDLNFIIKSSSLIKIDIFKNNFKFEDLGIGGLNNQLRDIFKKALSTRAVKSIIVNKLGIDHCKGVLLYGPPGTGKTLIARNIGNLLSKKEPKIINGPEILDKYVGESERKIRELFENKTDDLNVIIFDEIDAICRSRGNATSKIGDSLVNQLLTMIDGVVKRHDTFIIAMTNRKDLLDEALIRPGRIDVHLEIGLPNEEGRKEILRIHTKKMISNNMASTNLDIDKLANITENFSGAELCSVVKNASTYALHEAINNNNNDEINCSDILVRPEHFYKAIDGIIPFFGNFNKNIDKLLPENFKFQSKNQEIAYDNIIRCILDKKRLNTVLFYGDPKVGKSTIIYKIAKDLEIKYTKIVIPLDIISMDEYTRSNHIIKIINDAYLSEDSLVILDDIEILINFAILGNMVTFSNKLYQTLLTVIKSLPNSVNHKTCIVLICKEKILFDRLYNIVNNNVELFNI